MMKNRNKFIIFISVFICINSNQVFSTGSNKSEVGGGSKTKKNLSKKQAASTELFYISIKIFNGNTIRIQVNPKQKLGSLKISLLEKIAKDPDFKKYKNEHLTFLDFRIEGKKYIPESGSLPDKNNQTLEQIGLKNHSVINVAPVEAWYVYFLRLEQVITSRKNGTTVKYDTIMLHNFKQTLYDMLELDVLNLDGRVFKPAAKKYSEINTDRVIKYHDLFEPRTSIYLREKNGFPGTSLSKEAMKELHALLLKYLHEWSGQYF